jgi:hypothetical protein
MTDPMHNFSRDVLGKPHNRTARSKEVKAFQRRLASVRILAPACGSGNFLYVTLEHLKRLEGEVLEVLPNLGQAQATLELEGEIVRPEQFYGIEVNPWAAAVAELVLWIGYLQWHLRTRGDAAGLPEPILRNLHNIECRDAVLAWDAVEPLLDAAGRLVTRWDGRTTVTHPVTGEAAPADRVAELLETLVTLDKRGGRRVDTPRVAARSRLRNRKRLILPGRAWYNTRRRTGKRTSSYLKGWGVLKEFDHAI